MWFEEVSATLFIIYNIVFILLLFFCVVEDVSATLFISLPGRASDVFLLHFLLHF